MNNNLKPIDQLLDNWIHPGHLQQPMGLRTASLVALEGDPVPGLMQLCALYHPH